MLLQLICTSIFYIILTASSENVQPDHNHEKALQKIFSNLKPTANMTYIDKPENLVRVPAIIRTEEHNLNMRKTIKKNPKRTIQKIIKRNRSKKKNFMNRASSTTNVPLDGSNLDNYYAQEEMVQKSENLSSTQTNQKKKRKFTKKTRYPMPFQRLQAMKEHTRTRREDRNDVFIFTDLDEMEFLNTDDKKDNDVAVNAHVKKYW